MPNSFLYEAQIGPNRYKTDEGFLLCLNVPIARAGEQEYHGSELPGIDAGPTGVIVMMREEAEVFAPATMASFEGKPLVLGAHPPEGVTPENAKILTVGSMQNIRRGQGAESDLLIADLLVTSADAIDAVMTGRMREVSCGYMCDVEQAGPGRAAQRRITGNHLAIVADGRAGSRVAIKDQKPTAPGGAMNEFLKKMLAGVGVKTAADMRRLADQMPPDEPEKKPDEKDKQGDACKDQMPVPGESPEAGDLSQAVSVLSSRVDALEQAMQKLLAVESEEHGEQVAKPTGDEDQAPDPLPEAMPKIVTGDSAADVLAKCKVLFPAGRYQTGDSDSVKTQNMRQALAGVQFTPAGLAAKSAMLGDARPESLNGDAMAMAFSGLYAVIAAKADAEKEAAVRHVVGDRLAPTEQKETPEQRHDRLHAEFWAQQKGGKQ